MKRARFTALSLFLLLNLAACSPSAPHPEPVPPTEPAQTEPAPTAAADPASQPATEPAAEDDTLRVRSIRELLEAIAPGAEIILEPGFYNMSESLEQLWADEGEDWNKAHPYVQLLECFDGVEAVIQYVDDLSISGSSEDPADTELVTDPRYSTVLTFLNCGDLSLSNLTMGHTQRGDCEGNVIDLFACRRVSLHSMDLYGCGVYALGCYEGTGEVLVTASTLRDCSCGPLEIYGCAGTFEFRDCRLTGSEGFAWYEPANGSDLAFYRCEFGDNETSYFRFLEDVRTEDCLWSDNCIYPDVDPGYGEDGLVFDPSAMKRIGVLPEELAGSSWEGRAAVNPESGEMVELPFEDEDGFRLMVSLELWPDGIGQLDDGSRSELITWGGSEDDSLWVGPAIGGLYPMTPYIMGNEDRLWLLLDMGEILIWLY